MREDYKNDWVEASLVKDLNYLKTGVEEYDGKKDYYSTGSIKDDSINSEGFYAYSDRPSRANRVGQIGDILQARMKDTNKAVLINNNLNNQLFSTGFFQIRTDPESLLPKYLFHYFQSFLFLNQKDTNCSGSTQSALNDKSAQKLFVPISPIPIQRAIVAKIEELFSDLDKGIADLKKAQDQLVIFRQAVLKKAFEGELTKEWREKHSDINKVWQFMSFGNVFSDKPQNGIYKPGTDYGSGTKILRIDGFYNGVILYDYNYQRVRLENSEIKKYSLSHGDIVINRVNSMSHLGKCGLVKKLDESLVFESNIMKINLNFDLVLSEYITYYLASHKGVSELVKNAKQAVNQASINQKDVSNAIIPFCSKEEQHQVIREIESRLSVCDKVEQSIAESLEKAKALRQSILKKAFEGTLLSEEKIAKCKAAIDYEPASVLLKKIKAEKKK